ncbi:hypothetical protein GCM10023085_50260 [Actinomadura viridis]|uniref:Uncharacterized protein n=1 Tax=Actinomadura viridis TaxID=58110 RepID=A0A931DMR1_9ACTN|nr:hypothetical protein [Actinomadura viridis]MBG6092392.1 hypothetical protein [Actinomadura viridis]
MSSWVDVVLDKLEHLPADVREDYVRVLEVAVRVAPRQWTRRRGVRNLCVTLHDGERGVEVRTETLSVGDLGEYVDWDGPRSMRSLYPVVHAKLGTSRCAALVYGNAIDSRTWGWVLPLLLGGPPRLDTAVVIALKHRSGGLFEFYLPVTFPRRVVRRLRFEGDVRELLDRARAF